MLGLFVELPDWCGSTELSIDPALRECSDAKPSGLMVVLLLSEGWFGGILSVPWARQVWRVEDPAW